MKPYCVLTALGDAEQKIEFTIMYPVSNAEGLYLVFKR